jgi:hypothetical protein
MIDEAGAVTFRAGAWLTLSMVCEPGLACGVTPVNDLMREGLLPRPDDTAQLFRSFQNDSEPGGPRRLGVGMTAARLRYGAIALSIASLCR